MKRQVYLEGTPINNNFGNLRNIQVLNIDNESSSYQIGTNEKVPRLNLLNFESPNNRNVNDIELSFHSVNYNDLN